MSSVRFHFPKYKLAKQLRAHGGKSVAESLKDADAGLASIAGDCLVAVDEGLRKLTTIWNLRPAVLTPAVLGSLYSEVCALVGLCSAGGLVEMDRAAYSLCDLLDRMASSGRSDTESIEVHLRALALLRRRELLGQGGAVREIRLGLRRVRDKYATDNPGAA